MSVRLTATQKRQITGLWVMLHPGPSLVTTLAYALFAVLAARGHPDPVKLLVTLVGMASLQFAISALNDYYDRDADILSHKFKPVAQRVISPRMALVATVFFTVLMAVCYIPYGLAPLSIASAFLLLGFAYDLGLKSTPVGGVLMGIAFPLLPLLAWDLFATLKPALFWTFPVGLALGIAIHLADALPDVAADKAAGARGLAQALGRHALAACWLLLAGANLLIIVLAASGITHARPVALLITQPLAFSMLLAAIVIYLQEWQPVQWRLRVNFVLTVAIALLTGLGWLVSAVL